MLAIEGLQKSFGGVKAVSDLNLRFPPGSITAVIGPNGAGKTTLFNLITGHLRPDHGRIILGGEDIAGLHRVEIVRRGIGRGFQVASLFSSLSVEEAITATVLSHRGQAGIILRRFPLATSQARAEEIMSLLGLLDVRSVLSRNLSHGDQKLLDIGLALALEPRVLLLDEPTAGMGPDERWQMIEKVQRLWRSERMTLVFVEHDMDIVFKIAETVRVLRGGTVLAEGVPDEVRRNPAVIEAYLGVVHEEGRL